MSSSKYDPVTGEYKATGNYSGKRVTGQATQGILARECDDGALKQVLMDTRPKNRNARQWNNAESYRSEICKHFTNWKSGVRKNEPPQEQVEYLFKLAEWAKNQSVGEPGSVASGNTGSIASEPKARRRRGTRRRKTRRNRKNTRRH